MLLAFYVLHRILLEGDPFFLWAFMGAVQGVNIMCNLFIFLQYYAQNLNTQKFSHTCTLLKQT